MTKLEFDSLEEGAIVMLNGLCGGNSGIRCRITGIFRNLDPKLCGIHIETLKGQRPLSIDGGYTSTSNEISYRTADIIPF